MLEDSESALVEIELLGGYVEIPVDHLHEETLELVDVGEGDAADLGDELVGVVRVIEHLGCYQHCCQDQPKFETEQSMLGSINSIALGAPMTSRILLRASMPRQRVDEIVLRA